jgi:hypothetical protein
MRAYYGQDPGLAIGLEHAWTRRSHDACRCDLKAFPLWLLAVFAPWLWSSFTAAQTPGVRLVWERPVGSLCPSRAVLEADVEEVMGRPVFTTGEHARVTVQGVIEERPHEVYVRIEARSTDGATLGVRELKAPPGRCAALRAPIVLVLTLFVERDGEQSEDTTALHFGVGAFGGVASTPLPRTTVTVGPALSLELGDVLGVELRAAYWLPVSIETRRGVGAKLEAFSVALRTCVRLWSGGVFGMRLCAGAELGALLAAPLQLAGPERQARLLAHGLLDLRWETRLGSSVRVDVAVGPLLSLSRPAFSYVRRDEATMPVYRPHAGGVLFQLTFIILGS